MPPLIFTGAKVTKWLNLVCKSRTLTIHFGCFRHSLIRNVAKDFHSVVNYTEAIDFAAPDCRWRAIVDELGVRPFQRYFSAAFIRPYNLDIDAEMTHC